jgi:hypothetical protein
MPISSAQVTVTTSPTLLVAGDGVAEGVYLHAKHTMYQMDNGDKITINNHESPIYAISGSGTGTMQVLVVTK